MRSTNRPAPMLHRARRGRTAFCKPGMETLEERICLSTVLPRPDYEVNPTSAEYGRAVELGAGTTVSDEMNHDAVDAVFATFDDEREGLDERVDGVASGASFWQDDEDDEANPIKRPRPAGVSIPEQDLVELAAENMDTSAAVSSSTVTFGTPQPVGIDPIVPLARGPPLGVEEA